MENSKKIESSREDDISVRSCSVDFPWFGDPADLSLMRRAMSDSLRAVTFDSRDLVVDCQIWRLFKGLKSFLIASWT